MAIGFEFQTAVELTARVFVVALAGPPAWLTGAPPHQKLLTMGRIR